MNQEQIKLYRILLGDIKNRIRQAQTKAMLSVNAEMIALYWDIGRMIEQRQQSEGWSAAVIPHLSKDLRNELPEVKGFSERNIGRMLSFHRQYSILPQAVAKLGDGSMMPESPTPAVSYDLLFHIPWGHHAVLIEKVKELPVRFWYMQQTIQNGWSRNILSLMIESKVYERRGRSDNNFKLVLPDPQSDLAVQLLKDPYIFDFTTLAEPFNERELETELIKHLEKFLLELGAGFAFVGRQYSLEIGNQTYYMDLLFYHLKLRCYVVIDLKKGEFKPEHAGKMNFYCAAVDDILRHPTDQPSIGLILCQQKDKVVAEYTLKNISTPIGVSAYELTRALPDEFKSSLPSIEDLEAELSNRR